MLQSIVNAQFLQGFASINQGLIISPTLFGADQVDIGVQMRSDEKWNTAGLNIGGRPLNREPGIAYFAAPNSGKNLPSSAPPPAGGGDGDDDGRYKKAKGEGMHTSLMTGGKKGIYEQIFDMELDAIMDAQLKLQVDIQFDKHHGFLTKHGLNECGRVLDVGTGNGSFIIRTAEKHPQVEFIGLDLKDDMISLASKSAEAAKVSNVDWMVRDVGDGIVLPKGKGIDGILVRFVSMHIHRKIDAVLSNLFDLLKSGGRLWMITVDSSRIRGDYPSGTFDAYRRMFERANTKFDIDGRIGGALPAKLAKAGFTLETVEMDPMSKNEIGIANYQRYLLHEIAIYHAYAPEHVTVKDVELMRWFVENEVPKPEYDGSHGLMMMAAIKP
jgi:ubiquinone/menaquinone biosynthesis C-methylase UbiE